MFNKKLKQKIRLLEYENEILFNKIKRIERILNITPRPESVYSDYDKLKKKYR
jgi:hypothetical protein